MGYFTDSVFERILTASPGPSDIVKKKMEGSCNNG